MTIRDLRAGDAAAVARIDARHTGHSKPAYWARVVGAYVRAGRVERKRAAEARAADGTAGGHRVGLAACADAEVVGYLLGEVRAFEFGSEPCGWIVALGVEPGALRRGIASALLAEAARRFARAGVGRVRTMVRRNDVPVLAFFRTNGFIGGPFFQLELEVPPAAAGGTTDGERRREDRDERRRVG